MDEIVIYGETTEDKESYGKKKNAQGAPTISIRLLGRRQVDRPTYFPLSLRGREEIFKPNNRSRPRTLMIFPQSHFFFFRDRCRVVRATKLNYHSRIACHFSPISRIMCEPTDMAGGWIKLLRSPSSTYLPRPSDIELRIPVKATLRQRRFPES